MARMVETMRIFLVSSSIIENSLIYNLDYLIDRNITEVVMLRENHALYEHSKHVKYPITLCDTVSSAITMCDATIIIVPPNIQCRRYEEIYEYAKARVRETYYIDLSTVCPDMMCKNISYLANIPSILILAIGKFHQVIDLELSLNELFSSKNVTFNQLFSPMTAITLEKFEHERILNSKIINSRHTLDFDIQMITLCSESFELAFNDLLLLETVQNMKPSYVFLVSENNSQEKNELIAAFRNRLNCHFNSVLFSDYVSVLWYETPTPILITSKCCPYLINEDRESIWSSIIKNIAFPEGLKVIRTNR